MTTLVAHRVVRLLARRGLGPEADAEDADALPRDEPLLAEIYGASVHQRIAAGPHAGQRVGRLGDRIEVEDLVVPLGPRCASVAGFSVHANVAVPARDRARVERLCRYAARPPVATERLSLLPDGRVLYGLRHRWRDGTTHVIFEPLDLVARLAALVPPPRVHLVRYHGILAPAAKARSAIVPQGPAPEPRAHAGCAVPRPMQPPGPPRPRSRNYNWAELMRRVFEVDVFECPRCAGRMRILAAIHSTEAIRAILECLGLPTRAPPIAPAVEPFEEPEPHPC